mmetsp:Transcript_2447/g.3660  ORF Transcript_2447/g.3660 Transcript_2447/m.3660 type:complete len:168 (-) Transcript_2447:9-512(-)
MDKNIPNPRLFSVLRLLEGVEDPTCCGSIPCCADADIFAKADLSKFSPEGDFETANSADGSVSCSVDEGTDCIPSVAAVSDVVPMSPPLFPPAPATNFSILPPFLFRWIVFASGDDLFGCCDHHLAMAGLLRPAKSFCIDCMMKDSRACQFEKTFRASSEQFLLRVE